MHGTCDIESNNVESFPHCCPCCDMVSSPAKGEIGRFETFGTLTHRMFCGLFVKAAQNFRNSSESSIFVSLSSL